MTEKTGLEGNKISIIGCGNMGKEVIRSVIEKEVLYRNILISEKSHERRLELQESYPYKYVNIYFDNKRAVEWADIIILAVKPHQVEEVLKEIAPELNDGKMLISIVAGVRLEQIEAWLKAGKPGDYERIVRVMPNMFMEVGEGMIEICRDAPPFSIAKKFADKEDLEIVKQIFSAGGKVVVIDEKKIDAYSALAGSWPGLAVEFAEALIDAGIEQGIPEPEARKVVAQDLRALATYLDAGKNTRDLKVKTCSPEGSTIQGIHVLANSKFSGILMDVIKTFRYGAAGLGQEK